MELLAEVEVWYALPAIRRRLASDLKDKGLSQKLIAQKLGIAQSAVSHYLSGKRGGTKLPISLDDEFSSACQAIIAGEPAVKQIMRLSKLLKESRAICDVHRQHSDDVPERCTMCFD